MNHSDTQASTADAVGDYMRAIGRYELLTAEQEKDLAASIEAGLYAERLLEAVTVDAVRRGDLLTIREQGRSAMETFANANLRLVVSIAKTYAAHPANRSIPFMDLIQEGNLGLWRAVQKFDHTLDIKFSTYATWWIRDAVTRAVGDQRRTVRLPLRQHAAAVKVAVASQKLSPGGARPTVEELAVETGFSTKTVRDLMRWDQSPASLDEETETQRGAYDSLSDPDDPTPFDAAVRAEMAGKLSWALDTLPPRQAGIMALRFGLTDGREHTLEQIGAAYKLSAEHVRKLIIRSVDALREPAVADELIDYYEPEPGHVIPIRSRAEKQSTQPLLLAA